MHAVTAARDWSRQRRPNVRYAAALSFTRGAQITSITCERPNCNQAVELSGRIIEYCIPYSSEVLTFTLL